MIVRGMYSSRESDKSKNDLLARVSRLSRHLRHTRYFRYFRLASFFQLLLGIFPPSSLARIREMVNTAVMQHHSNSFDRPSIIKLRISPPCLSCPIGTDAVWHPVISFPQGHVKIANRNSAGIFDVMIWERVAKDRKAEWEMWLNKEMNLEMSECSEGRTSKLMSRR